MYKLYRSCDISHMYKLPLDVVRTSTMVFLPIVLHHQASALEAQVWLKMTKRAFNHSYSAYREKAFGLDWEVASPRLPLKPVLTQGGETLHGGRSSNQNVELSNIPI